MTQAGFELGQDRHAAAFAAALFRRWPEWRRLARVEHWPEGADWLVIELPAPEGADLAGPLEIEAAHGDVTVFFDHGHAHFAVDADAPATIARVLDTIDAILCGDVLCLSETDGKRARAIHFLRRDGSRFGYSVEALGAPGDDFPLRIRSWHGAADIGAFAAAR